MHPAPNLGRALVFLPLLALRTAAQALTNATCGVQFTWMNNAYTQSPCLVAAYLAGVCNNGQWIVASLNGVDSYAPPSRSLATPCECNTVFYNLIQACSACQGGTINQWDYWVQFCPQSYIAKFFPYPVPSGSQVPTWADIDPTIVGFWSPNIASAYAVGPSAAFTPFSTSPAQTSTPAPTTIFVPITPTPTPTRSSQSKSSTPVGAIVGGAVAGAVLLFLIGFGIWFLCIRDQKPPPQQQAQNEMRSNEAHVGVPPGHQSSQRPWSQSPTASAQQQPPHRFYPPSPQNPSNPIFYPSAPSSNNDVPPLPNPDPIRQNLYPGYISHQNAAQFSSSSPQPSPPLEPMRGSSTFGLLAGQRNALHNSSYGTT